MAQIKPLFPSTLLAFLLLLSTAATPTYSFSFPSSGYRNALSLSQTLLTRVSALREARGDSAGAGRARLLADKLERASGLGLWRFAWSFGCDFVKNYAWSWAFDRRELIGVVSELNELARALSEFTRAGSDGERVAWVSQNYGNVLRVSKSALGRLLNVFRRSGPLKEAIETVQREVVEGNLLRDCLELGSNDWKGLIQIINDLTSQFYTCSSHNRDSEL